MSIDMTLQNCAISITGVYGQISHFFVGSNRNFVPIYLKKNVDTYSERFSSKKQFIKKVIAKKPLTNLYEMNSR